MLPCISRQPSAVKVTSADTGDNQLLYFTSPSLTLDDRHLVFISDRTGDPNLFTLDLATGSERQLTFNAEGVLKSYVYFDGQPFRGFGKGSVSLDARSGTVWYIQGRRICAVKLDGSHRVLAELPGDQMTAFTHVSADGSRLCVPTTDARVLDGDSQLAGRPDYDIDQRVQAEGLSSYLRVYSTASGAEILCERVPNAWVTHAQFSPADRDVVLYNHEYCADSGIRRMWLWDGARHVRLRTEGDGRNRKDWTCHEMWERDGTAIIYHGTLSHGASYIGRVRPDGSGRMEIPLEKAWTRYGHFTVGKIGQLITDGCYQQPDDPESWGGAWISLLKVDWDHGTVDWTPLLRHGSSWTSQDSHPHPVFNHAGDSIWFSSDQGGHRAIRSINLK
jgi:hypothetical protein